MARTIQARVYHPLDSGFKNMVCEKLLENCPVKLEHITNANNIFGPNFAGLMGGFCENQSNTGGMVYIPIPRDFYVLHNFLTLRAYVMFVNCLPFFIMLSRKIKMFTAEYIPTQTSAQLSSILNKIVKLYSRNGFVC